ncbi:MAG: hypothetical protein GY757_47380, partial [bacterium]|nr:hypothetical protein [bacterium]
NAFLSAFVVAAEGAMDKEDSMTAVLKEYLQELLPDYMIPSYFIPVASIPLTSNGKIDRKALYRLQTKQQSDEFPQTAPRNEIEKKLVALWAHVLDREVNSIGIDTNFFQLGGHSLRATILTAVIHKELNVKVPLAELFRTPTIRGLAEYIRGLEENKYTSIQPTEKQSFYPL